MPISASCHAQRLADHLRTIAPARNQTAGSQHVGGLARPAPRAPWRKRPYAIAHPDLARASEPPRRQQPRAGGASQLPGRQRGLHTLLGDRDRKHQRSVGRSRLPKSPRHAHVQEGAARVAQLPHHVTGRVPTRPASSPPGTARTSRFMLKLNGAQHSSTRGVVTVDPTCRASTPCLTSNTAMTAMTRPATSGQMRQRSQPTSRINNGQE